MLPFYLHNICYKNHPNTEKLLKLFLKYDVLPFNDDLLIEECQCGHFKIVKLLLEDGRHPLHTSTINAVIRASISGSYEIVRLLMNDPRVHGQGADPLDTPHAFHNWALHAVEYNTYNCEVGENTTKILGKLYNYY